MHHEIKKLVGKMVDLGCRIENRSKHATVLDPGGSLLVVVSHGVRPPGYELIKRMRKRIRDLEKRATG